MRLNRLFLAVVFWGILVYLAACSARTESVSPTQESATAHHGLLNSEEDCQLPCWAGITPGQSTGDDVLAALQARYGPENVSIDANGWTYRWFSLSNPVDISGAESVVFADARDNTASYIFVNMAQEITVRDLIEQLGEPDRVRITVGPQSNCVEITLLYPNIQAIWGLARSGWRSVEEDQPVVNLELQSAKLMEITTRGGGPHSYDIEWKGYDDYCPQTNSDILTPSG